MPKRTEERDPEVCPECHDHGKRHYHYCSQHPNNRNKPRGR